MDEMLRIRYPFGAKREHVPVDAVRAAFAARFGTRLCRLGFRPCSPSVWITDHAAPVRHVVHLSSGRGHHSVMFGLKFDFVPFITDAGSLKLHSDNDPDIWTLDLIHDPYAEIAHDPRRPFRFGITSLFGTGVMERQMRRECRRLSGRIGSFVRSVGTLAGALNAYHLERERAFRRLGYENRVQHWVSYPFVLMANGQQEAAAREFEKYLKHFPEHAKHRPRLERMLQASNPRSMP